MSLGISEVDGNSFVLAAPAAVTSTAVGSLAVDMTHYIGSVAVVLTSAAASAGTNPTLNVKLQTSATAGGSYADLSGATFTEITDAADSTQQILIDADSIPNPFLKPYPVSATPGGQESGGPSSVDRTAAEKFLKIWGSLND